MRRYNYIVSSDLVVCGKCHIPVAAPRYRDRSRNDRRPSTMFAGFHVADARKMGATGLPYHYPAPSYSM